MEIERKWLVKDLPDIDFDSHYLDEQFYLSVSDNEESRVRKCVFVEGNDRGISPYLQTHKVGNGLCRQEHEGEIPQLLYEQYLRTAKSDPITKDWYSYIVDGQLIEFSIVDNGVFVYAEVEFESVTEANAYQFPWPELIIKEVTGDSNFAMKNYWKNGSIPLDI